MAHRTNQCLATITQFRCLKRHKPSPADAYLQRSIVKARLDLESGKASAGKEIEAALRAEISDSYPDYLIFCTEGAHYQTTASGAFSPIVDSWIAELETRGTVQKILAREAKVQLRNPGLSFTDTESAKVFRNFPMKGMTGSLFPDYPISQFKTLVTIRNRLRQIHPFFNFSVPKTVGYFRAIQTKAYLLTIVVGNTPQAGLFFEL